LYTQADWFTGSVEQRAVLEIKITQRAGQRGGVNGDGAGPGKPVKDCGHVRVCRVADEQNGQRPVRRGRRAGGATVFLGRGRSHRAIVYAHAIVLAACGDEVADQRRPEPGG
jgi:hypothetical protein